MYSQFYGFRDKPFSLLPDPEFLFLSQKHEKALSLLELGILNQSGFCVISGDIGAGKTTLVRELLNRLDDRVRVGLISNTHSAFSDLLGWVLAAYKLESESNEAAFQHRLFTDFIIEQYAGGKHTLLIIDEAQNLSLSALEQLRMLSNINSEKDLVLQIILIGQGELRTKLQQPELEQFAQRIAIDYHLTALDQEETAAYIRHRVIKAGGSQQLFDDAACSLVYQYSEGIPRLINRICDLGLVYGFSENKKIIDARLINAVTKDQEIGRLIKTSAESPIGNHSPVAPSNSGTLSGNGTRKKKVTPEPVQQNTGRPKSTTKGAKKGPVKISTSPSDKGTEAHHTREASSAIYTAAEIASVEKTRAESIATEKNNASNTIVEKSKTDATFVQKVETEKLVAEKLATEKAAAEKAAAVLAEASMAAANLAESEKLAAEKDALKVASVAEQATEFILKKKQTAEKLIAEKTRIEKEALEAAAAAKTAAEKTLAERIVAEKAAAETAAAADDTARRATANRVAAEKAVAGTISDSEAAAKRALTSQADAARIVAEKAAADKAAIEKARADTDLAKKASTERVAADAVAREKAVEAKQAAQKAAASRAAAEKSLAEKIAADTLANEKASLEKVALAKVAVSAAAAAQQAAAKAAAARAAAQKEASEKEAAAVEAARRAVEASAFAEKAKAAAENRSHIEVTGLSPDKEPEKRSRSVNRHLPAGTQPQIPAIRPKQPLPAPRLIRSILTISLISGIVAASVWLITRPGDTGAYTSPPVAAGESFTTNIPTTEAAALESAVE